MLTENFELKFSPPENISEKIIWHKKVFWDYTAKAGHLGRIFGPDDAQMWPSAWAKKSIDPAQPQQNRGPARPRLRRKNGPSENSGPGVKLIEAKNIKAWAITELKRKTRARSEIMARAKN